MPHSLRLPVAALVATLSLSVAAAELAVPFRPLSLDAAQAAAVQEGKLVFIDFFTTWCAPCKLLDAETFSDAGVGQLVGTHAVALKLDAEKEGKAAAKTYAVAAYPTLLVLRADGTEVDRLIGFKSPAEFKRAFQGVLETAKSGKSPLERARLAVAATGATADASDDVDAAPHFELAKRLLQSGDRAAALKELLWCWDEGKKDPEFARMQRSLGVPRELARLAADYPPAGEALRLRRDQARARVLANKGGSAQVQDFLQLNRALKEDEDTLAIFDQMPEGDRRKVTISIYLFDFLVEKRRYADAILFNGVETQLMQLDRAKQQTKQIAERGNAPAAEQFVKFAVRSSAKRVEALAGAGKTDDARELAQRILATDGSDETKQLLREHLARAGQPELLKP